MQNQEENSDWFEGWNSHLDTNIWKLAKNMTKHMRRPWLQSWHLTHLWTLWFQGKLSKTVPIFITISKHMNAHIQKETSWPTQPTHEPIYEAQAVISNTVLAQRMTGYLFSAVFLYDFTFEAKHPLELYWSEIPIYYALNYVPLKWSAKVLSPRTSEGDLTWK